MHNEDWLGEPANDDEDYDPETAALDDVAEEDELLLNSRTEIRTWSLFDQVRD